MIYINDFIIIGNTKGRIAWLEMELKRQFKMTDLEQFEHYFSVNFTIFKEGVFCLKDYTLKRCFKVLGWQTTIPRRYQWQKVPNLN
jgi:hypothetical protein